MCVHMSVGVHACVCTGMCVHVFAYACKHVYATSVLCVMHVSMHVCAYVRAYVCHKYVVCACVCYKCMGVQVADACMKP